MEYQPGDSLGVTPLNPDGMVDALLRRLEVSGGKHFRAVEAEDGQKELLPHLGCPCSLRSALQRGCDLTSIPRCSDTTASELTSSNLFLGWPNFQSTPLL
jgi:sulfite reductase alpha subunit-like flavoprotein